MLGLRVKGLGFGVWGLGFRVNFEVVVQSNPETARWLTSGS